MSATTHPTSRNLAGRGFLTGLGILLAAIGGIFVWLMWRSYDRAREMHDWPKVPCIILSSEVEERRYPGSRAEFRLNVIYGYEWSGERLTGELVTWRGNPWSSKPDVIASQVAAYPVGLRTTCSVNPDEPGLAVLKPDSMGAGYSIWFPALFVVGGLGIAFHAVRRGIPPPGNRNN